MEYLNQRSDTYNKESINNELAATRLVTRALINDLANGLGDTIIDANELALKKAKGFNEYLEASLRKRQRAEEQVIEDINYLRLQGVKAITDIESAQLKMHDKQWLALKKQTQLIEKQRDLMRDVANEIANTFGDVLDEDTLNKLTQRKLNLKEQENQKRETQELVKQIPLIGTKLGELGDIRVVYQEIFGAAKASRKQADTIYADLAKKSQSSDDISDQKTAKQIQKETRSYLKSKEGKEKFSEYKELKKAMADWNSDEATSSREANKQALKDAQADLAKSGSNATDEQRNRVKELEAQVSADAAKESDQKKKMDSLEKEFGDKGLSTEAMEAEDKAEKEKQKSLVKGINILASIAQELSGLTDEIAQYQGKVDTRLNGSILNDTLFNSYWQRFVDDTSALIASPLITEKAFYDNLIKVVDSGIARDVEQMAMLETIKDKIATTFNLYDSTMLRLIKVQDENTAAARLGMEAKLNEILNEMFENTEYLSSIASNVRTSLEEAEALMGGAEATEFEYEVQKWLGSLYSAGMSQSGVQSIATAFGKLAAGDIEGITTGGAGNLMIMAANLSNLSIADILAEGIDASNTNVLLNNAVTYLSDLADEANGNNVVQQQLAKVFGLTASDLKAVKNIISTEIYSNGTQESIFGKSYTYEDLYGNVFDMANSMYSRMSTGEMLTNMLENVKYSTASGMAIAPMYIVSKVADILDSFVGGIPIPAVEAFSTGIDTKLTVANIMRASSLSAGFITSLIAALSSGGNAFTGTGLLEMVGLESSVKRGTSSGQSGSASVVNGSLEDMESEAESESEEESRTRVEAAEEESTDVSNSTINDSIVNIYNLLEEVVAGTKSFYTTATDSASWLKPTLLDSLT